MYNKIAMIVRIFVILLRGTSNEKNHAKHLKYIILKIVSGIF